jgi:hypothetical protein
MRTISRAHLRCSSDGLDPQRLKPDLLGALIGTTEVVPFPVVGMFQASLRGAGLIFCWVPGVGNAELFSGVPTGQTSKAAGRAA